MKSYQTKQFAIVRSFLITLFAIAILQTNAQMSGLGIAATNSISYSSSGEVRFSNKIEQSTAASRKLFNEVKKQQITKEITKDILDSTIVKKVPVGSKAIIEASAPVVTTSGTIYDIPGITALHQYTSLQASFKFTYDLHGLSQQQQNISDITQVIELYKLEKGTNTRSFCIPSGSCSSINIAIQITGNGLLNGITGSGGAAVGKSVSGFTVVFPSGYLAPGEYAFIDKSSLTTDGTSLRCFAFTVKQ
ncbi:MAG: hypothetical protein ABJA78_01960 [Ferruginibacter sp.]